MRWTCVQGGESFFSPLWGAMLVTRLSKPSLILPAVHPQAGKTMYPRSLLGLVSSGGSSQDTSVILSPEGLWCSRAWRLRIHSGLEKAWPFRARRVSIPSILSCVYPSIHSLSTHYPPYLLSFSMAYVDSHLVFRLTAGHGTALCS